MAAGASAPQELAAPASELPELRRLVRLPFRFAVGTAGTPGGKDPRAKADAAHQYRQDPSDTWHQRPNRIQDQHQNEGTEGSRYGWRPILLGERNQPFAKF